MSSQSHDMTQGRPPAERCDAGLADALLASSLPCALIDGAGVVSDASEPLRSMAPRVVGQSVEAAFDLERSGLLGARGGLHAFGVYENAQGELIPAMFSTLYDVAGTSGSTVAGVMDGAPFRHAETERFASTPYTVMRVSPDGIVRFANEEGFKTFACSAGHMIGQPLSALFSATDEENLGDALKRCVSGSEATSVEVTPVCQPPGGDHLKLLFTPDMAPEHHVLGAVVMIPSALERVRDEIAKLALDPSITDWQMRLASILQSVRRVIDFDHANFGVYAEEMTLFRSLAIYPDDGMKWPARWMKLPPFVLEWVEKGETWIDDIGAFVSHDPLFRQNEVVQHYRKFGIVSSVTLVATGANGQTTALSLSSLEPNKYGQRHLNMLRGLELEDVQIRIEEDIQTRRRNFLTRMGDLLVKAKDLQAAARDIVDAIAAHFVWDYVALFRVDRYERNFTLMHQNPCKRRFHIEEGYKQPIDSGMLAATYDADAVLTVNAIGSTSCEQHGYLSLGRPARSAMTIPIHLNRRVRWILNIETKVAAAFLGPDKLAIEGLIAVLEQGLTQRMLKEVKKYLMRETEQGVLIVGVEGAILEMNPIAAELLGRKTPKLENGETPLLDTFIDKNEPRRKDIVSGVKTIERRRLVLQGQDGKARSVLGSRKVLDDSFDTALWFLTDIETDQWTMDLVFLRETVSDVAQQTRAPLALASSMARQLSALWDKTQTARKAADSTGDVAALCRHLVGELGQADITFERLAEGLAIRKHPMRIVEPLDLRYCVDDVINLLPDRDRDRIDFEMPDVRCAIQGDAGRLAFVVRSLVAHLVRVRVDDESRIRIQLALTAEDPVEVVLTLALTAFAPTGEPASNEALPTDVLWLAHRNAREDASLATQAINMVIEAHHGSLDMQAPHETGSDAALSWTAFRVTLPYAPQKVAP
ncbi:PAS domain-containing protein [Paraburkholderia xenovorans]|uniref:PAS domain-containing protein n=1 Tax=Paraburkholderia xenovorans TaxID=36873 RepID=UPI0038B8488B